MSKITILTPTYNRANMLPDVYNSLLKQTDQSFQWLVIDDGSTDDTAALMKEIVGNHEADFTISYYQKANGGKHTALNYAHPYIQYEWITILDSDDLLVEKAVEIINVETEKYKNDVQIGWIACLRGLSKDVPYGPFYRTNYGRTNYISYMNKGRKGEVLDIYRTSVFKEYSYPEYTDEKFVSENYLNIQAAVYGKYEMITINKVLSIAEYQSDGYTKQGRKLQLSSPKGHAELWKPVCFNGFSLKQSLKGTWLYIVYGLFSGRSSYIMAQKHRNKWFVLLNTPFGYGIYWFWKKIYME